MNHVERARLLGMCDRAIELRALDREAYENVRAEMNVVLSPEVVRALITEGIWMMQPPPSGWAQRIERAADELFAVARRVWGRLDDLENRVERQRQTIKAVHRVLLERDRLTGTVALDDQIRGLFDQRDALRAQIESLERELAQHRQAGGALDRT